MYIIPNTLLEQLALGGCLIIPVGGSNRQKLLKIIRNRFNHYEQYLLENVKFVPLREGLS